MKKMRLLTQLTFQIIYYSQALNASGKSTFMKAVALNLILAQSIQTATAHSFIYQPGYVMTSMANADDVLSGDSYFMSELKSIRRLFNTHQCNKIYCFIDEIFKGTNTTERIAASESVLSYLDNQKHIRLSLRHMMLNYQHY